MDRGILEDKKWSDIESLMVRFYSMYCDRVALSQYKYSCINNNVYMYIYINTSCILMNFLWT